MFVNATKEVACNLLTSCNTCVEQNGACAWIGRLSNVSSCVQSLLAQNVTKNTTDGVVFVSRQLTTCLPVGTPEEVPTPASNIPYTRIEINDWLPLVWILSIIILVLLLSCLAAGIVYCICIVVKANRREGSAPPVGFSLLVASKDNNKQGPPPTADPNNSGLANPQFVPDQLSSVE